MADNKEQKSNIKGKAKGVATFGINKILIILNVLAILLVFSQMFGFMGSYSKKTELMFAQGRIINIDPKANTIELTDISEKELQEKRNQAHIDKVAKGEVSDELVGPLPPQKGPEEFVGPMPADAAVAEKTEEQKKPKYKPADYTTANLAIIITEIGPKGDNLQMAMKLPKEVTFAFSPYTDDIQKKTDVAFADGRVVLLNLMMQPSGFPMKDNGPMSVQVNYDENQNLTRFEKTVGLSGKVKGVLAVNDEIVTSKFDKVAPILKKTSERAMYFGYFKTTNNQNVENDAKPLAADIFGVDYLVDETPGEKAVLEVMDQVKEELVVGKKKLVIAIRPYPSSIETIGKWLDENLSENIQIAPINYFVTNN